MYENRHIFVVIFIGILLKVLHLNAYVTLQNNFVVLRTRDSGTFVGVQEAFPTDDSLNTTKYLYAFRGIPYAKPPLENLRFKEPEAPDVTAGPKDATTFKAVCPQFDHASGQVIGNVDCLYLNIFTPRLHFSVSRGQGEELSPYDEDPRHTIRSLPVLVYVHSGNFVSGSGDMAHFENILDENVLLVTLNYRLGVFGFLSSATPNLPGNIGLYDQIACLKWIRKNVHRFGGDPNRVTIFGQVSSLIMSHLTSDLYQGVILLESEASVFSGSHIVHEPRKFYSRFLSSIKCNDTEVINCLQSKNVEELMRKQAEILEDQHYCCIGPVIGNFTDSFPEMSNEVSTTENLHGFMTLERHIMEKTFLNVSLPIMFGVNSVEGFRPFYKFYKTYMADTSKVTFIKDNLSRILSSKFSKNLSGVFEEIWKFYFASNSSSNQLSESFITQQMLKLFGDISVYNANWELTEVLAERDAIAFSYLFEHNSEIVEDNLKPANLNLSTLPWEEEYYLFSQFKGRNNIESASDIKMSRLITKIFTSFAAYRTPKSAFAKEKIKEKWTQLASGLNNYFHIKLEGSKMRSESHKEQTEFWRHILSKNYPGNHDSSNSVERNLHIGKSDSVEGNIDDLTQNLALNLKPGLIMSFLYSIMTYYCAKRAI